MYRLAVCEDEKELRETLCRMCGEILDELGVEHRVFPFSGAEELADVLLGGERFDLLCLDIYLSGKSGMELAQELRDYDEQVSILFVTSSEEHLKEGYRVRPIQYLFKPVDREELMEAIQADLRLFHQRKSLVLRSGGQAVSFPVEDVLYIESRDHAVEVQTVEENRRFWLNLAQVERRLPAGIFCRCHNSFLVNMAHIVQITRKAASLDNGMSVPVSRGYYETARSQFLHYLNTK